MEVVVSFSFIYAPIHGTLFSFSQHFIYMLARHSKIEVLTLYQR